MDLKDIFTSTPRAAYDQWQVGSLVQEDEYKKGSIALIFCSEERGAGQDATPKNYDEVRKNLFSLSHQDWKVPIVDMGDLISGNTLQDTHYIIKEVIVFCLKKKIIPIVIGGSNDLSAALFFGINSIFNNLTYTQINCFLSLQNVNNEKIDENSFLTEILSTQENPLKHYNHLGFQRHLNEYDATKIISNLDFDLLRLAEMMGNPEKAEPFFRKADLVTVCCDAVESNAFTFSLHGQVNGLNRREICAHMKDAGLSDNLKCAGIFNYNSVSNNMFSYQLLAQMIWHLIDGINIQKSHPSKRKYETFWLMLGDHEVAFKRDTFSNLWYYGKDKDISKCLPCTKSDFEEAQKGNVAERLLKFEQ